MVVEHWHRCHLHRHSRALRWRRDHPHRVVINRRRSPIQRLSSISSPTTTSSWRRHSR
jgi:hypothetical protein